MIKTTTLRLPSETLIELKALAIRKGKSQNDIINEFINKGLKTTGKELKIKKMPLFFTDKKGKSENIEDLAGFVEIEDPENIDVNELIDNIHYKKELY